MALSSNQLDSKRSPAPEPPHSTLPDQQAQRLTQRAKFCILNSAF